MVLNHAFFPIPSTDGEGKVVQQMSQKGAVCIASIVTG